MTLNTIVCVSLGVHIRIVKSSGRGGNSFIFELYGEKGLSWILDDINVSIFACQ